jgi:hypothetical protein
MEGPREGWEEVVTDIEPPGQGDRTDGLSAAAADVV